MRAGAVLMRCCPFLVLLLVLPSASAAVVPPGTPGVCEGTCVVQGSGITGFIPPVLVLRSGSTVDWQGLDGISHVNAEDFLSQNPNSCFNVAYGNVGDGLVTFKLQGGGVVAVQNGIARQCMSGKTLGTAAVLTYYCKLHSLVMKGALVIVA